MKIELYSFADVDRSGKVRWTALELGCEIEEHRVKFGDQRGDPYRSVNPWGQIPAAIIDGERHLESSAICRILAERQPDSGLIPAEGPDRDRFHELSALATETLEFTFTAYLLSRRGIMPAVLQEGLEPHVKPRAATLVESLPKTGFLIGDQLTLADIFTAYVVRIGIQSELIQFDQVAGYLEPLMERPAAKESRFFSALDAD